MNGIKIKGTGHSVPAKVVTNEDLTHIVKTNDEWIISRTGIRERRHCVEETHTSLSVAAAREAMERAGISPDQVGVCIVATMTPDWLTPSAACLLQRELGLLEDTPCFDLNAACSGFLYGLHTIECLLAAAPRKYGLLVGSEVLSRMIDFSDRSTCILFGDGAGAVVVESAPAYPGIHAVLGARGDETILNIPGTGTGRPSKISMEGTAVFKFAVDQVPRCMETVLEQAGMTVEEVDFFVFHQANERIIDHVVKKHHIPQEKYYKNISRFGNTSAASVPIALDELVAGGTIRPGMKVLCVGFGGGLTWGGALVEFT